MRAVPQRVGVAVPPSQAGSGFDAAGPNDARPPPNRYAAVLLEQPMSRPLSLCLLLVLAGCQSLSAGGGARPGAGAEGALARLAAALPGDYDNHEQVVSATKQDAGGAGLVPLQIAHSIRMVSKASNEVVWLWQLRTKTRAQASLWLFRAQADAQGGLHLTPYRPLDPAAATAQFADAGKAPAYDAAQWTELAPCAETGAWKDGSFSAAANVEACSALLPGLGEDAALLPLRVTIAGEMLQTQTFADRTRGEAAGEEARRVRWYSGWAAINGGGPHATAQNQDWHLQRELRLGSEGDRVPLRWRDGTPSGYSLELERTSYPERKLSVLQLNVVEDASGNTLTYVWTDPHADAIGLNLGWLQGGFTAAARP
jgi:hypothetical protein